MAWHPLGRQQGLLLESLLPSKAGQAEARCRGLLVFTFRLEFAQLGGGARPNSSAAGRSGEDACRARPSILDPSVPASRDTAVTTQKVGALSRSPLQITGRVTFRGSWVGPERRHGSLWSSFCRALGCPAGGEGMCLSRASWHPTQ